MRRFFKTTQKSTGKTAPRRGTLQILCCILFASAALRFIDGSGQVHALSREGDASDMHADSATASQDAVVCETDPDLSGVLAALKRREDAVLMKEQSIADRMTALSVANRQIDQKLAQLTEAEAALKSTLALADEASENDLARLTAVYENMKPQQAAELFEQMEPNFAAGFLGRMQPASAAGVMASLTPETAYTISVVLAGRNTNVPKN